MHKSAMKCNKTVGKWCKNKHGASKIIDTFETYQPTSSTIYLHCSKTTQGSLPATPHRSNNWINYGLCKAFLLGCILGLQLGQVESRRWTKTTFITPYGVFCYQVMLFSLKNAGATYQRMMQNCLRSQMGCSIQVYIGEVVITTQK
jgi:hypothetical protein